MDYSQQKAYQGFLSSRAGWSALLMSLALLTIIGLSLSQGTVSMNTSQLWQAILPRFEMRMRASTFERLDQKRINGF